MEEVRPFSRSSTIKQKMPLRVGGEDVGAFDHQVSFLQEPFVLRVRDAGERESLV